MEGLPPLLESDYHDLCLTNGAQGLWSFSEILAARLPELKEAFLCRSASPGSNQDSSQGLGSQDPLVNNTETSMPHHPRRVTAPPLSQEDGPVTSFPEDAFLSLPSNRFSGSYTDFLLEENSSGTIPDHTFNEGLQGDQIHFTQATTATDAGDASLICFQAESWTAGMELGQPGSIMLPEHGDEEISL